MNPMVERARRFANKAHANQKYGDEFPYFVHLWSAYNVALRFGVNDPDILAAVLLHDTIEDAGATYTELETLFSPRVAQLVDAVSEPNGLTRKERHAASYPRIRNTPDAVIVKLCDRISHMEFGGKKTQMYVKEHSTFRRELFDEHMKVYTRADMWTISLLGYLDDLIAEARQPVTTQ